MQVHGKEPVVNEWRAVEACPKRLRSYSATVCQRLSFFGWEEPEKLKSGGKPSVLAKCSQLFTSLSLPSSNFARNQGALNPARPSTCESTQLCPTLPNSPISSTTLVHLWSSTPSQPRDFRVLSDESGEKAR